MPVERARPLLGTIVRVRASGPDRARAGAAVAEAFARVARAHALMSFHEATSELSALNRAAAGGWVEVATETFAVLACALALADESGGAFDPAVGGAAVAVGALPRPKGAPHADPGASWRDVVLDGAGQRVRFARPLWLDLGGIAKGYAVDAALAALREAGCTEGLVNAGGDLAVFGPRAEPVALRCGGKAAAQAIPVLELADGAAASSATTGEAGTAAGAHFAGAGGARAPGGRFVTVAAPTCLAADALTKVVLARGAASSGLLARHGARAFLREADGTWLSLGATACEAAA